MGEPLNSCPSTWLTLSFSPLAAGGSSKAYYISSTVNINLQHHSLQEFKGWYIKGDHKLTFGANNEVCGGFIIETCSATIEARAGAAVGQLREGC